MRLCGGVAEKANSLYRKAPVRVAKNLTQSQAEATAKKFLAAGWHVDLFAGKKRVFSSNAGTNNSARTAKLAAGANGLGKLVTSVGESVNGNQTVSLKRIYSENRAVSLCVPLTWELKSHLNADALMQLGRDQDETYLIVIAQAKHSFGAVVRLQSYASAIVNAALGWVAHSKLVMPAVYNEVGRYFRAEIAGKVGVTNVQYQICTFECKKQFYTVYVWTNAERYKAVRPLINAICGSFKLSEQPSQVMTKRCVE
ncbi:hypothetical protein QWY82_15645 [Simiduia curdlanivorans]|uniref:Uncharacterized protein n=1 Tax=Simiduia curdlanivorans TaxID=1492769 RepID=A0ABV8V4B9_9GAMM|nr:hypothetical protein [Simiduia curdlanivorans]MDN3640229.1 hypothetical protein [Simiduia curdlanivorans]